jgi:hypothetical protein
MLEAFHFAIRMDTFHAILDLGGTFVFALSGGVAEMPGAPWKVAAPL